MITTDMYPRSLQIDEYNEISQDFNCRILIISDDKEDITINNFKYPCPAFVTIGTIRNERNQIINLILKSKNFQHFCVKSIKSKNEEKLFEVNKQLIQVAIKSDNIDKIKALCKIENFESAKILLQVVEKASLYRSIPKIPAPRHSLVIPQRDLNQSLPLFPLRMSLKRDEFDQSYPSIPGPPPLPSATSINPEGLSPLLIKPEPTAQYKPQVRPDPPRIPEVSTILRPSLIPRDPDSNLLPPPIEPPFKPKIKDLNPLNPAYPLISANEQKGLEIRRASLNPNPNTSFIKKFDEEEMKEKIIKAGENSSNSDFSRQVDNLLANDSQRKRGSSQEPKRNEEFKDLNSKHAAEVMSPDRLIQGHVKNTFEAQQISSHLNKNQAGGFSNTGPLKIFKDEKKTDEVPSPIKLNPSFQTPKFDDMKNFRPNIEVNKNQRIVIPSQPPLTNHKSPPGASPKSQNPFEVKTPVTSPPAKAVNAPQIPKIQENIFSQAKPGNPSNEPVPKVPTPVAPPKLLSSSSYNSKPSNPATQSPLISPPVLLQNPPLISPPVLLQNPPPGPANPLIVPASSNHSNHPSYISNLSKVTNPSNSMNLLETPLQSDRELISSSQPNPALLPKLQILSNLPKMPIPKEGNYPFLNLDPTSPRAGTFGNFDKAVPGQSDERNEKGLKVAEESKGNYFDLLGFEGEKEDKNARQGVYLEERKEEKEDKSDDELEEDGELLGGLNVTKGNEGRDLIKDPQLKLGVVQKIPSINLPGLSADPSLKNIPILSKSSSQVDPKEDNHSNSLINDNPDGILEDSQLNLLNVRDSADEGFMLSPPLKLPPMGPPIIPIETRFRPASPLPVPQGLSNIQAVKPNHSFPVFGEQGAAIPAQNIPITPKFPAGQALPIPPIPQNTSSFPKGPPISVPVIENKFPDNTKIPSNPISNVASSTAQTAKNPNLPPGLIPNVNFSNPQNILGSQPVQFPKPSNPSSQVVPPFPQFPPSNSKPSDQPPTPPPFPSISPFPNLPLPPVPNHPLLASNPNPKSQPPSSYLPKFPGTEPLQGSPRLPIPDYSNNINPIDANYKLVKPVDSNKPNPPNEPQKLIPGKAPEPKSSFKPDKGKNESKIIHNGSSSEFSSGDLSSSSSSSSEEEEKQEAGKSPEGKAKADDQKKKFNFAKEGEFNIAGNLTKSQAIAFAPDKIIPKPELIASQAVKKDEAFCIDCMELSGSSSIVNLSCGCVLCYMCIVISTQTQTCNTCKNKLKSEDIKNIHEILMI